MLAFPAQQLHLYCDEDGGGVLQHFIAGTYPARINTTIIDWF